jgi:ABC-type antimicrobial peptide transport system permease subunit
MAAIWMRVRSELREGRRSVFALALLIAIAGAAALAPLAGAKRTGSAYERFLAASNAHDLETNEGVPGVGYDYKLDLEKAVRSPEVAEFEINRVFLIGARTDAGADLPTGAEAVVVRPALFGEGTLSLPRVIDGRLPDRDRIDEVAVGYGLSVREGIHVGDRMTIDLLSANLLIQGFGPDVKVVHQQTSRVVGVILLPGSVPPAVRYGQIFATPAFEAKYTQGTANARGLLVKLKRGSADIPAIQQRYNALAGGGVQFLTGQDVDLGVTRSIDLYVVALQAFAALAGLAALLIVTQTLARQVALGADDDPVLRSIGMTPGQIAGGILVRTGISVTAGVVGAIAIGYAFSPIFPVGTARVVEPTPGFSADALVLVGGGAGLLLLILTFAIPPALSAARRAAREPNATQPEGQAGPSRIAAWLSGTRAPASIVAGIRLALERGHGRTSTPVRSTILASAVAVASIVTLVSFGTSLRHLVDTPRLYGWNWDTIAGNPYAPDLSQQVPPILNQLPGVAEFSGGATNVRVQIARDDQPNLDVSVLALSPYKGEVFTPVMEGRWPVDDDEVALGTGTMRTLDVGIGERVAIVSGEGRVLMTVVGRTVFPVIGDQYGGELGRGVGFTVAGVKRVVPNSLTNFFPVRFRAGFDFAQIPEEFRSLFFFEALGVETVGQARPVDLENLSKIEGAPLALMGLVALLGIATIAHALGTSVRRRRRDLAILKTLGFVRGQIRVAVITQATTLALLALALGIPIGMIVGRSAWLAFADRQGVVPEALLGSWTIVAIVPATVLLANLVAALPGRAAARLTPATVLRTE